MFGLMLAAGMMDARLDGILGSENLKSAIAGVVVLDAQGKVLYNRSGDLRLIPASNQKILAAAYAMGALGPDFRVKTRFWKKGADLIIDAPGDPSLTQAKLREAASKASADPGGQVKVRQGFRVGPPPTWEWDDLPYRYAAPITAWTVDRSSWELWAEAGKLVAPPSGYSLTIRHRRQTGSLSSTFDPWSKTLELNGALREERFRVGAFALPDPDRAAASFFGGKFVAQEGDLPSEAPTLEVQSPPISALIKDCLEPSDNIYAEHLLLLAAGKDKPLPSEAYSEAGGRMRDFFVAQAGLAPTDLRPVDGSGLSRQNLVTPMALAKVLRWADRQPWGPQFVEGLAAPGEGTLSSRLKTVKFAGKTGTINAVSSLSGIIRPGEANRLYISIVFNSAVASSSALRALQDEIVSSVEKSGKNEHPQSPADSPDDHAHSGHRALDVRWLP